MNNNLIPLNFLNPFKRFLCTIGNLPTSYLLSLSYEEQLLWLCNYLENTVIPAINNNAEATKEVQDLIVELQNYFKNLDVQEEINNKLDAMIEDGTLATIINETVFAKINKKSQSRLNSTRLARFLKEVGLAEYNVTPIDNLFAHNQGFCIKDNSYICSYLPASTNNKNTDNCQLAEINRTTGVVTRTATLSLKHANSICYNPLTNELIIPECFNYQNVMSNYVNIVDYETFTIKNRIAISGLSSISSVCFANNKLYACTKNTVNELNENYEIVNTINLEEINENYTMQTIKIKGNFIYKLIYNPNYILKYNMNGQIQNIYRLAKFIDKTFITGEVEDFDFLNDDIIISSMYDISQQMKCQQIFKVNEDNIIQMNYKEGSFDEKAFYVDLSNTTFNPDGTLNNPFKEIAEINLLPKDATNTIYVVPNENIYKHLYIIDRDNVEIRSTTDEAIKIGGIRLIKSNNIILNNVEFYYTNPNYINTLISTEFVNNLLINIIKTNTDRLYTMVLNRTLAILTGEINTNEKFLAILNYGSELKATTSQKIIKSSANSYSPEIMLANNINKSDIGVIEIDNDYKEYYGTASNLISKFKYFNVYYILPNNMTKRKTFKLSEIINTNCEWTDLNVTDNPSLTYFTETQIDVGGDDFTIDVNHAVNLNGELVNTLPVIKAISVE